MAIITISRLTGSGGREIALAIAEELNFQLIDRNAVGAAEREFPINAIAEIAARHNVVILGSGGQFLFAKLAASLHVQIVAPLSYRIARVMKLARIERAEAESLIEKRDRDKEVFLRKRYGKDWRDPAYYDLVLNIDRFSNETAVDIICGAAGAKRIEPQQNQPATVASHAEGVFRSTDHHLPEFAHASEREFARVMDFYRIRWQYEPRTFPIEWDEAKNVVSAFTPDFYLPDLDLFIELTTMKQSLVTKKNRKVRLLRQLYPDVNIKILYERDYTSLSVKYGLKGGTGEKNKKVPSDPVSGQFPS
jgi:cytidylate kinase